MAAVILLALQMMIGSGTANTANATSAPSVSQSSGIVVTDQSIVN